jgi:hypothetical protein
LSIVKIENGVQIQDGSQIVLSFKTCTIVKSPRKP